MTNVIDSIVKNNLCVGCGICLHACPDGILHIQTNGYGELVPFLAQECQKDCGACYKVCPFGDGNSNEDQIGQERFSSLSGIKHDPATGFYLSSFVGHVSSEQSRERSASGGLATWILKKLLLEGCIDAAICVSPSPENESLYTYRVAKDVEDIESCSGSAYYPVQLSDVISYITRTPGRYAITALPCFTKGLRLAQKRNNILRERIVCILGLTCGQMKNKQYTRYLAPLSGVQGELSSVHYRGKAADQPTTNYFFSCESENGEKGTLYWDDGASKAWLSRWFTLNACNYCDDIYAECADAVVMDAWLPEYVSEWRGTNLLLVRDRMILELVTDGVDNGEIIASSVPVSKIVQSQSGLIVFKRDDLRTRLWIAKRRGDIVPTKRVTAKRGLNGIVIMKARLLQDVQEKSKKLFNEGRDAVEVDIARFQRDMERSQTQLRRLKALSDISTLPLAAIRRLRGGY